MPVSRCRFVTSAGAVKPGAVMPGERGMNAVQTGFWRDRPTLVTGATGLVGGWGVRGLLEPEADGGLIMGDWARAGGHPYDVSKSCADLIAQSYASTYGTPVVITRCGNFFGGGDLNWSRIVPGTIRSLLRGQAPVIRSDGTPLRDYFYVEDGAAAYLLLAERLAQEPPLRGQAFNFSNETPVTVIDLVEKILRMMGSRLTPEVRGEAPNEIREQFLDASKARTTLGWRPVFTLDAGLRRTITWYRSAFDAEQAT